MATKKAGPQGAGNDKKELNNNLSIPGNAGDIKAACIVAAECYLKAGLSVIPVRADGTKCPAVPWKHYQSETADLEQVKAWAESGYGIGIVCGTISGNLEVIDFDDPDMWPKWIEALGEYDLGDLLSLLYIVETPGPGLQAYYRCDEPVESNKKLALRASQTKPDRWETVIETRGEGGYVIAAGSPPSCHQNNTPYRVKSGRIEDLPVVTAEQRDVLLCAARELNEWVPECRIDPTIKTGIPDPDDKRPGSVFNREAEWYEILDAHGWELVRFDDKNGMGYWRRPDKDGSGWSATTDYGDSNLFYVFSTNAEPFEPETSYSKFAAYTLLEHEGDFKAAVRQLLQEGYGEPSSLGGYTEEDLEEAREAIESACETDTAQALYEVVEQLAKLEEGELGDILAERKKSLGSALDLRRIRKQVERKRAEHQNMADAKVSGKPSIQVNGRDMEEVTKVAMAAIVAANDPPVYFTRTGCLVRLRLNTGRPIIDEASVDLVRCRMAETSLYVKQDEKGIKPVSPPIDIARNILAQGQWSLPELEGIVQSPVLRPDGTLLTKPGYDPVSRLYYSPVPGLEMEEIPENPDAQTLDKAVGAITDILCDFPFIDESDKANAVAMMLTPVVRPAIDGYVPLAVVTATQPASGKGLLVNVVNQIVTGREASIIGEPVSHDEWRKQITTHLSGGACFIVVDNVEDPVGAASLAAVLTAGCWSDRLMGTHTEVNLPNRAFWIVTGNNVMTEGDIARRCFWVRLDPKMPYPEQRMGFRHERLLDYVRAHRGKLLVALLTISRAWFTSGCPRYEVPVIGSFQEWAHTVGSILAHAGVGGFMGNAYEQRKHANQADEETCGFLVALCNHFSTTRFTTAQVCDAVGNPYGGLTGSNDLRDSLPDHLAVLKSLNNVEFTVKLGKYLSRIQGKRFGQFGVYIERCGSIGNRVLWQVIAGVQADADSPPVV